MQSTGRCGLHPCRGPVGALANEFLARDIALFVAACVSVEGNISGHIKEDVRVFRKLRRSCAQSLFVARRILTPALAGKGSFEFGCRKPTAKPRLSENSATAKAPSTSTRGCLLGAEPSAIGAPHLL